MKFSLLSITAVLASFVAATPILAPPAAFRPFILKPASSGTFLNPLQMKFASDPGFIGYFRLGWFQSSVPRPLYLNFPNGQGEGVPGRITEASQSGYELVFKSIRFSDARPEIMLLIPLLAVPNQTGISSLHWGNFFLEKNSFLEVSGSPPSIWTWAMCQSSATDFDLIFTNAPEEVCAGRIVRRIQMGVEYLKVLG